MRQVVKKNRAEANAVDTTRYIYTVVFDMNNLMKISFVDKRMNDQGLNYGMVYRTLKIMGDVLTKKDFNYCIACYDGSGSGVMRYKYYHDYKANRGKRYGDIESKTEYDKFIDGYVKAILQGSKEKRREASEESDEDSFERQSYVIKNILEELCVRQYEFENVEGDDIIAYYVKNKKDNEKVVIVSSDKDLTQLISPSVVIYNPMAKEFITHENSSSILGITHENIVTSKILCGDASDNIKGIDNVGMKTLIKYFPRIVHEKMTLEDVVSEAGLILEERAKAKKKPLRALVNIVDKVCSGIQGKDVYEVNKKIIDLSEPMMSNEAVAELEEIRYAPMDTNDRTIANVYKIVEREHLCDLYDEDKFGEIFGKFNRIMTMERRYGCK